MKLQELKDLLAKIQVEDVTFMVRMKGGELYCASELECIEIQKGLPNLAQLKFEHMLKAKNAE